MKQQPLLEVVSVPTDELVPYEGNAKLHPDGQIRQLEGSIREFDFSDPVGAWHDGDGRAIIVEGHGRLLAARRLGMDEVPTIELNHLSDEQRRAYGLVHNQLTLNSGFDFAALQREMADIDIDLEPYGLSEVAMPDMDDLFEDDERTGEDRDAQREPRTVRCPCCGEEVEV